MGKPKEKGLEERKVEALERIAGSLDLIERMLDQMLIDRQCERINARHSVPEPIRRGLHLSGPHPIRELMPEFLETRHLVKKAKDWDALPPEKKVRITEDGKKKNISNPHIRRAMDILAAIPGFVRPKDLAAKLGDGGTPVTEAEASEKGVLWVDLAIVERRNLKRPLPRTAPHNP